MKNRSAIALFLAALLVLLSAAPLSHAASTKTAKMLSFSGDVKVVRAGSEKPIKVFANMRLAEGDKIVTGASSTTEIEIEKGVVITVAANSAVVLSELTENTTDSKTTINLQSGGVGSQIDKPLKPESRYRIKTPTTVMGVRGTEFYVQYENGNTDLWVASGTVQVDFRLREGKLIGGVASSGGVAHYAMVAAPGRSSYHLGTTYDQIRESFRPFDTKGLYPEFIRRVQQLEAVRPGTVPAEVAAGLAQAYQTAVEEREQKEAAKPPAVPEPRVSYDDPTTLPGGQSDDGAVSGQMLQTAISASMFFPNASWNSLINQLSIGYHTGTMGASWIIKVYEGNNLIGSQAVGADDSIDIILPGPPNGVEVTVTAPGQSESDRLRLNIH